MSLLARILHHRWLRAKGAAAETDTIQPEPGHFPPFREVIHPDVPRGVSHRDWGLQIHEGESSWTDQWYARCPRCDQLFEVWTWCPDRVLWTVTDPRGARVKRALPNLELLSHAIATPCPHDNVRKRA